MGNNTTTEHSLQKENEKNSEKRDFLHVKKQTRQTLVKEGTQNSVYNWFLCTDRFNPWERRGRIRKKDSLVKVVIIYFLSVQKCRTHGVCVLSEEVVTWWCTVWDVDRVVFFPPMVLPIHKKSEAKRLSKHQLPTDSHLSPHEGDIRICKQK